MFFITKKEPEMINAKDSIPHIIHGMLKRSTDGVVSISPGIANRILEESNFPGQRRIKAYRVEEHARRLATGNWIKTHAVAFARLPNGLLWLVDGQHRLSAIGRGASSVQTRVLIHDAASEDEARRIYASYDGQSSVRSVSEVLDGLNLGGELNINKRVRDAAFRALAILHNGMEIPRANRLEDSGSRSQDFRRDKFPEWEAQIKHWDKIYKESDRSISGKLINAGLVAVGLYTLKHQPLRALDFWFGLARNDGLRKYDPRHTLIQDFHTRVMNSGSARQSVQSATLAWNAFFENRQLKIIKCIEGAEIRILGTPMANGQKKVV